MNVAGVDIGGTFTDLVLSLPERTLSSKVLTTHEAPDAAEVQAQIAELESALASTAVAPRPGPCCP